MRFQFSKGESRDRVIFRADLDDKFVTIPGATSFVF